MLKPLRALIIEDVEDDMLLLLRVLRQGGFDVTYERVETAVAFQSALIQKAWDIIIADYSLPRFTAPTALKLLRERGLDIPFIVVSGTIGEETAVEMMRIGAHDYLMKDNLARLVPAVTRELEDAQMRRTAAIIRAANRALSQSLDLDEVLNTLLNYLEQLIPYDSANVMLRETDTHFVIRAIRGYKKWADPQLIDGRTFDTHTYREIRKIVSTRESVLIPDTQLHAGWHHNANTAYIRNWLGVPLVTGGKVIGLYSVDKAQPGFFTQHHIQLADTLAAQAAVAIQNARFHHQIQQHADELEQRVEERTRKLAKANEQLQELDRLKSKFVADVTHELRTPVTNLKLYLDLWERGRPENRSKYITVIREQSSRLEHLIIDILSLSHLEKDESRDNTFKPVDLNKVTAQVFATYRPHAEAAEIELHFEPEPDLPLVLGRENQLAQVVTNLITNAINYTAAGHVDVSVYLDAERSKICLQVSDTGMGIAQEECALIFDRFYRGERTGQFNIPGTGLGLAIVKEIIDQHSGAIKVQSEVDVGSTFWVWLPLVSS